jgi:putative transposase
MGGKGGEFNSVFVERLWCSIRYERVYLHEWDCINEAQKSLGEYFYNNERPHQGLSGQIRRSVHLALH